MREPSVSTPSPVSATQVAESTSVRPKTKRNRVILSCQPCHRRKQQCDRGHPCSRCVSRGCPDSCTYEDPKEVQKRKSTDPVSEPVQDNAESPISFPNLGQPNGSNSTNDPDPNALVGLDALLQVLQNTDTSSVVSPPSPDSFDFSRSPSLGNENAVQLAATALNQLSQQEAQDGQHQFAGMTLSFRDLGNLSSLSQHHFPNQKITTFLLSYYFDKSSAHWIFPVIHRPSFESFYRTFSSGELPPTLGFVALLSITCATALQFLPETDDDDALFADYAPGRKVLEKRLMDFSRSVLFTCTDFPHSSFERIQAFTLLAVYLWNDARAGESWYIVTLAIRMAQALSLNRDGTTTWRMRSDDAEIRRRMWWTLFKIDRFLCIEYRRPYIISEQHADVALPLNLDEADIVDTPNLIGKPVEEPTEYLFHLYDFQFWKLSGHMWDQCFSTAPPTYQVVMDWEEKLKKFELDLPTSLRYQTTQTATARPYLSLQYQSMVLGITYHRMQLLRPFLFTHPTKEKELEGLSAKDMRLSNFHKLARSICITFCKRQLASLQMQQSSAEPAHLTWSGMTLMAFKAALSIAIAIIMDPRNPENEELEEWIAMAQGILLVVKPHNVLAQKALDYIQVIRKRTLFVLGLILGRCASGDPLLHQTLGVASAMGLPQRIDRTTRTLSQPQPSLTDLLGREEATDPFWSTLQASVFAGNFPGIESLISPVSPENLEQFLDSCISMYSRLPCTF